MDIIYNKDILDSNGKNKNFLTDLEYTQEYINLANKWKTLPMYKSDIINKFFDLLHNNQVILLISGTGSGKTVLVPKFFLKYVVIMNIKGKIAITNPKILTTIYNAQYSAKTLDVKLGEEVGYKYRGAPNNASSSQSKLLYVTDGLILAIILGGDTYLKDYIGLIIDEAHERHIQIDLLLRLVKIILLKRPEFKLIIMSATINAEVFREYFNIKELKYGEIEIATSSNLPIDKHWLDKNIKINRNNYLDIAVEKCLDIIKSNNEGDIIIFIPLKSDATKGCELLKLKCPSTIKIKEICDKLYCVGVYSQMKESDREIAVSKDLYKKFNMDRKIIFATNVAESSITFDGLIYVIDTGLELLKYYDYIENKEIVTITYTSQAQIKQRIGRVGRTLPGKAYLLYNKNIFDKLKLYPEPSIVKSDLTIFVLSLIKSYRTINNILLILKDMITIPNIKQIIISIHKLSFINAIKIINNNNNNNEAKSYEQLSKQINGALTSIGLNILKFKSCDLFTAYSIIISSYMNCLDDIIIIMAILEITQGKIDKLFNYNKKEKNIFNKYIINYSIENSDHLTILNIFLKLYKKNNFKFLNKKIFINIEYKIKQLKHFFSKISDKSLDIMYNKYNIVSIKPFKDNIKNILYTLAISHKYNIIQKANQNFYKTINFLNNNTAKIKFANITKISKKDLISDKYAICMNLSDVFNKKEFKCISIIPNNIYKLIK